jgi:5-(carboxyamino)imidazole ribonucleotide mutase
VIGVPRDVSLMGLDALLSMVQMPKGVPVAVVGINQVENAAILAARILAKGHSP